MKASIEQTELLKAMAKVQSIVERRTTIPILSNVLIEAKDSSLYLRTTDLDIEVLDRVEAIIETPGSLTVGANTLYEIVRKLPDGSRVEFLNDIEDKSVDVFTDSCSVTHFNFGGGQNPGWKSVLSGVYQKLKPGGYFLIVSDCHSKSERKRDGEFLLGEEIAATAKECGFTLTPEFNDDKMDIIKRNAGRETDLNVATFMLKK